MTEPDYSAQRKLPEGVTCASCVHAKRCDGLFGAVKKGFTSCDFLPSRFRPRPLDTAEAERARIIAKLRHESDNRPGTSLAQFADALERGE